MKAIKNIFFFFKKSVCVYISVCMCVRIWQFHVCMSANDNFKQTESNIRYDNKVIQWNTYEIHKNSCIWVHKMNVRQQLSLSRQKAEIHERILNKTWWRWQAMASFPFLAPWSSRPPAIETPPRPVPAGPLISWSKNASCSRIPPRASRASLTPRRWAMTRHRLSLCPCTAPLSCSLQPLLNLSFLSPRPSVLQFVLIVSI